MSANTGRANFVKWLNERRATKLAENSTRYAKLPENIRAAIAKVAGVKNETLDNLTAKDRRALFLAVCDLQKKLEAARYILTATQIQE